ncbi:MAG: FtsX-like permease family protein [Chlorobia bacterium]|nr:FtsX-like permease family protein [Fimbriimonadaceae bacterium]
MDRQRMLSDLTTISAIGSRLTGSKGENLIFEFSEQRFRSLNLKNIRSEDFSVTIPDPESRGWVTFGDKSLELYPMWPNLVRTSTCHVTGRLVYGGTGTLEEFKGKDIKGAIVVLEFNSGTRWRNAARLGAAAAIFLEPKTSTRSEAELKFGSVPLSFPRFYIPIANAGPLLDASFSGNSVHLKCTQNWIVAKSKNLLADIPGTDSALDAERVLISANADASSVVPAIAPGAESATSIAALLEMARIWSEKPGKRPVTIMVSGAHMLGLQGAREFVDRRLTKKNEGFLFAANIDFSTGSPSIGAYGRGWYYEYRDEVRDPVLNFARILRKHADNLAPVMNMPSARMVLTDSINQSDNRTWKNNIPGRFAFDCEPMLLGGYNAITFATIEDSRDRADTPFDTLDKVNLENLATQTKTLAAMLHHALNDTSNEGVDTDFKVPLDVREASAMRLTGGFASVDGYVAVYDPAKSFVPDVRITDALAVSINVQKSMMGVRGSLVQQVTGQEAKYRFPGLALINSFPNTEQKWRTFLAAFRLDPTTGNVDHAVDFGIMGAEAYPTRFELKTTRRTAPIVIFKCRSVDFYSLVDPQDLRTFMGGFIMDAKTNGDPQFFGFFVPYDDMRLSSEIDDTACLFMPPGTRFKILFGSGMGEYRLILSNSTEKDEAGVGYLIPGGEAPRGDRSGLALGGRFPDIALNTAKDIVAVNEARMKEFAKYRIISPGIRDLQDQASAEVELADKANLAKDWSSAERHSRAAWGYALRAHPIVAKTTGDVVNGVIFYLFLIVPFSYFIERLFFAHRSLTKQLGTAIAIFILSFVVLRLVHPAFEIVKNPMMIFVAFVMGALSIIVIFFILGKFESSLKALRQLESGVHEVDIRRGSVAMAAFNLGVSNMRRRKARTFLTTLTLVVMTFIVLSFTSIVPDLQINELPSENPARYTGMLIRNAGLEPLQSATFRQLSNEFAGKGEVVRRTTYYGADIGDSGVLSLQRASRVAEVRAMVGFDPAESKVTRPQDALLPGGRWFQPGDGLVMILPQLLAETLKVEASDIGKATVRFGGNEYLVIGIIDSGYLRNIQDLDGDGILAPDFSLSRQLQTDSGTANQAFRSFLRLDPGACFLVPSQTALSSGADIRSIVVTFQDAKSTRKALNDLMPRLRLNLYAAVQKEGTTELEVRQFSILQASKGTGLGLVLIQLAIAAVFVLNTMIASVFERTKEISIFSSIGLAPNHIAMLFFAESLVYGVLGAVFGYFVAQVAAKIIVATGILPSLYLNFSSSSAVLSAGLVMGTVIASTIYPARKASQIAAPAQAEEAFETEPDGDVWRLPLPFSVSTTEAAPLAEFLGEWLLAYEGYTIGEFVTSQTVIWAEEERYYVRSTAWLAPYDLGVSQDLVLSAEPGHAPGVYVLELELTRTAGEAENWVIVNGRFLANLRKQFLTWRTLTSDQREKYSIAAKERFEAPAEPLVAK